MLSETYTREGPKDAKQLVEGLYIDIYVFDQQSKQLSRNSVPLK